MGRRGPAPQPTALKVLNGNPGKRALPKDEPKPEVAAPRMPEWLDAEAKKEWRRVLPMLLKMRLVTEVDGTALAAYCETYSTYVQASKILQDDGFSFLNEKTGVEHARPEVSIVQQCRTHLRQYAAEFGLTPSARGRMTTTSEGDSGGEMENLLGYKK